MEENFIELLEELKNYNRAKNRLSHLCLDIFLDLNRQKISASKIDFLESILEPHDIEGIANVTPDCVQLETHNTSTEDPVLYTPETLDYWLSKAGVKAVSVLNEDKEAFSWYNVRDLNSRGKCRLIEKLKLIT